MKVLFAVVVPLLFLAEAHGQTIGVFADSTGLDCNLKFPEVGITTVVYVVATIEDEAADGATSAIFRSEGLPDSWAVDVIANPEVPVVIGDPFGIGVHFAFSSCHTGRVMLMTIEITPHSVVENGALSVVPHSEFASGCGFEGGDCGPCERFCGCGDLFVPCYCARGITSTINEATCTVAVSDRAWGNVKRLYR